MQEAPASVFTVTNGQVVKSFDLPTNNISYSPINGSGDKIVLVPYKFDYDQASSKVKSTITVVDLKDKSAHGIDFTLDVA